MTSRDDTNNSLPQWAIYALLALTGVFLAVSIWQIRIIEQAKASEEHYLRAIVTGVVNSPVCVWAVVNTLFSAGVLLWAFFSRLPEDSPLEARIAPIKMLILTQGFLLGLSTFIFLGPYYAWKSPEWHLAFGKGREAWKEWDVWVPVIFALAGLGTMFASLLVVRSEERNNPGIRRLIYGYNAVLTGLLLAAILLVVNVMVHFYNSPTFDWTASHIYSISDDSKRMARELKNDVQAYIVMPANMALRSDVEMLLNTIKAQNSTRFTVHPPISPTAVNEKDLLNMARLHQMYDFPAEDSTERDGVAKGVLIVVTKNDGKEAHEFVKRSQIEEITGGMSQDGSPPRAVFKGEQAIMSAIHNLTGDKEQKTLYFTQGNGEPKLDDFQVVRSLANRGLGVLKSKLETSNYTVKELTLVAAEGTTPKVPEDAFAVVIAGPATMEDAKVEALREYMKREKSKMLVMMDVNRNKDWQLQNAPLANLEKLLEEYGAKVGNDIILNAYNRQAGVTGVHAILASQADKVFQDAFQQKDPFNIFEARSVRPAGPSADGVPSKYSVQPLLDTWKPPGEPLGQWAEDNPAAFLAMTNEEKQNYAKQRLDAGKTAPAIPLAVTVREKSDKPSADPHAFMKPDTQGEPRLVVFGDVTMACNYCLQDVGPDLYYDLINGSLSWLRGHQTVLKEIKPRTRMEYTMKSNAEQLWQLQLWPGVALLFGVVVIGAGVLLMRRR